MSGSQVETLLDELDDRFSSGQPFNQVLEQLFEWRLNLWWLGII